MSIDFENELYNLNYKFNDHDIGCIHENKNSILYFQDINYEPEYKVKFYGDLDWLKIIGWEDCVYKELECIDCGSHYNNLIFFIDDKLIEKCQPIDNPKEKIEYEYEYKEYEDENMKIYKQNIFNQSLPTFIDLTEDGKEISFIQLPSIN